MLIFRVLIYALKYIFSTLLIGFVNITTCVWYVHELIPFCILCFASVTYTINYNVKCHEVTTKVIFFLISQKVLMGIKFNLLFK